MKAAFCVLALAGSLVAQPYYPRHNFTLGLGAADPQEELTGLFTERPGLSVGYGYRFLRFFQADFGLDTVFGAGQVHAFLQTPLGFSRIRDYQFFVPFGGRAIIPVIKDRLLLFGGGGGAYLRYTELLHQPSDFIRVDCPVCGSRSGWGYYAQTGLDLFLDRSHHFRLGFTAKEYRAHTSGDQVGPVTDVQTRDRWLQFFGNVGFSF